MSYHCESVRVTDDIIHLRMCCAVRYFHQVAKLNHGHKAHFPFVFPKEIDIVDITVFFPFIIKLCIHLWTLVTYINTPNYCFSLQWKSSISCFRACVNKTTTTKQCLQSKTVSDVYWLYFLAENDTVLKMPNYIESWVLCDPSSKGKT